MKTTHIFLFIGLLSPFTISRAWAQNPEPAPAKLPIYANVSIGHGNTFGTLAAKETINDGRGFGRNQGNTLTTWFYVAPNKWKGLGVGAGAKGFFATPNNGGNNETYLFNYYRIGVGPGTTPSAGSSTKGLR